MIYTSEIITDNSPGSTMTPTPVNNPSSRKSERLFTNKIYVKNKPALNKVADAK